jgi:hypothetical protein
MRKREVIEFRNTIKMLKPTRSPAEQAVFERSLKARPEEFNRNPRAQRALHSAIAEQERSCILHESGTR